LCDAGRWMHIDQMKPGTHENTVCTIILIHTANDHGRGVCS